MEYKLGKWSLADLYPEDYKASFNKDLEQLNAMVGTFEQYRAELSDELSGERFAQIMKDYDAIVTLEYKLYGFCSLRFEADTQDSSALSLLGQTEAVITELGNRILFFDLWWTKLADEPAARLIASCPQNAYYLSAMRLSKPYTLNESEEKIINIKNSTGASALDNIYSALTNRYVFKLTLDGEEKQLTREGLMVYARSDRAELRAAAYEELYRVYGKDGNILGQIYQNICRSWDQECLGIRGYKSPMAARNLGNDIPDEVVDLLLETCRKNRHVFIDYFKLKKELLGLDELHRRDLYAPMKSDTTRISFDEAFKTMLAAYNSFDPEFANMAERVYNENHIDSEPRHGKRGGAFCETLGPTYTPWVLLNFHGRAEDTSTIAHELGHAIHSMSAEDKTIFQQSSCLPLAETASTFGEMLLADYLQRTVTDSSVLRDMLIKQLDDNYATIQRQAYFALFEKEAHSLVSAGADIDELNAAYLANLKEQFGDALVVDDYFKWEWVSIPHIFATPFYVYAYAFGQLLVLALYAQYKKEGKSFIPRYKEMLRKGGSQRPQDLLSDAGFDFTKESFWQGGFDILNEKVAKLREITR